MNNEGSYILHEAVILGVNPNNIEKLINLGCEKEKTDIKKRTPLHLAIEIDSPIEIIKKLTFPNLTLMKNLEGRTPLMEAIFHHRSTEILDLLYSLNKEDFSIIDGESTNTFGYRSYMYRSDFNRGWSTRNRGSTSSQNKVKSPKPVIYTLKHKYLPAEMIKSISSSNQSNILERKFKSTLQSTSIHYARTDEEIKWIISKSDKEKINSTGGCKRTALHHAAIRGDIKTAHLLIKNGANINCLDCLNYTPLLLSLPNIEMFNFLIENGADIKLFDCMGWSCVHYSIWNKMEIVFIQRLIDMGCPIKQVINELSDLNNIDYNFRGAKIIIPLTSLMIASDYKKEEIQPFIQYDDLFTEPNELLKKIGMSEIINYKLVDGFNPLHYAAANSRIDLIDWLVELGFDINSIDSLGNTPLHMAATSNPEVISKIIELGGNINALNRGEWTPIHFTCLKPYNDNFIKLKELGADLTLKTTVAPNSMTIFNTEVNIDHSSLGNTIIDIIASNSNSSLSAEIINSLPNIDVSPSSFESILINNDSSIEVIKAFLSRNFQLKEPKIKLLIQRNNISIELLNLLIENGFDLSQSSGEGFTLLHHVCSHLVSNPSMENMEEFFDFMIKHVDIDSTTFNGESPILQACCNPFIPMKILKKLISDISVKSIQRIHGYHEAGTIDLDSPNAPGEGYNIIHLMLQTGLPLLYLQKYGMSINQGIERVYEISEFLMEEYDIDPNERDHNGNTSLHLAISTGSTKLINLFLDFGADPNSQNVEGDTPLLELVKQSICTSNNVKLLVTEENVNVMCKRWANKGEWDPESGENPTNLRDYNPHQIKPDEHSPGKGSTILHEISLHNKFADVLPIVIQKGAKINCRNQNSETPLHIACQNWVEADKIIEILLNEGADVNALDDSNMNPLMCVFKGTSSFNYFDTFFYPNFDTREYEKRDKIIELLLSKGTNILNLDVYNSSALLYSLYEGASFEIIKKLIHKKIINKRSDITRYMVSHPILMLYDLHQLESISIDAPEIICPMHIAALLHDSKVIDLLKENGSEIQFPGGIDPIHLTALLSNESALKSLLPETRPTRDGWTILHLGCLTGSSPEYIQIAIESGANPNQGYSKEGYPDVHPGLTPFHCVFYSRFNNPTLLNERKKLGSNYSNVVPDELIKREKVIDVLIKNGADPSIPSHERNISYIFSDSNIYVPYNLRDIEINHVNEPKNWYGPTALHIGVNRVTPETYKLMFSRMKSIPRDGFDETPLHYAATSKASKEIIEILSDMIHETDIRGRTPLHLSLLVHQYDYSMDNDKLIQISLETVNSLIEIGSDINKKDNFGNTPLHYLNNFVSMVSEEPSLPLIEKLSSSMNESNIFGQTPLATMLSSSLSPKLIFKAIKHGARFDKGNVELFLRSFIEYIYGYQMNFEKNEIEKYIKNGLDIYHDIVGGITFSHFICLMGWSEALEYIIKSVDINKRTKFNEILLHYACMRETQDIFNLSIMSYNSKLTNPIKIKNRLKCIKLLIEAGSDVNCQDKYEITPFHNAVMSNFPKEILEYLVEKGADPTLYSTKIHSDYINKVLEEYDGYESDDSTDAGKCTVLHMAGTTEFDPKVFEWLLSFGIDINSQAFDDKRTALGRASNNYALEIIITLLNKGANPNICDNNGIYPINDVIYAEHPTLMNTFINSGLDLTLTDSSENSLLHMAMNSGKDDLAFQLLEAGANPNQENDMGQSPMHLLFMSSCVENFELVKKMIEKGGKINEPKEHDSKNSPFHYAAMNPSVSIEIYELLLKLNPDFDCRSNNDESILTYLIQSNGAHIIKMALMNNINVRDETIEHSKRFITSSGMQNLLMSFNDISRTMLTLFERQELCDGILPFKEPLKYHSIILEARGIKEPSLLMNEGREVAYRFLEWVYAGIEHRPPEITEQELNELHWNERSEYISERREKIKNESLEEYNLMKKVSQNLSFEEEFKENRNRIGVINFLQKLYNDENSKDFSLIVNNKEIKVHRVILLMRSELFRALFVFNNDESPSVQDYSGKSFEAISELIKFFYTDSISEDLNSTVVNELEDSIEYYQLSKTTRLPYLIEVLRKKLSRKERQK